MACFRRKSRPVRTSFNRASYTDNAYTDGGYTQWPQRAPKMRSYEPLYGSAGVGPSRLREDEDLDHSRRVLDREPGNEAIEYDSLYFHEKGCHGDEGEDTELYWRGI